MIKKAIAAGKHVLSEKPIAKDLATARELIEWYKDIKAPRPIWGVAENFRFIESVTYATEQIRAIGGEIVTFSFSLYALVKDDDKYFNTDCAS